MKRPIYKSKPLQSAFNKGMRATADAENPYLTEIRKPNGSATWSKSFINAWFRGREYGIKCRMKLKIVEKPIF